jgi:hypothetical protein
VKPSFLIRVTSLAAAGAVVAAAVAGCASGAAGPSAHQSSPAGLTSAARPAKGTPKQQAEANAAQLVKAFVPPPGARQTPRSPVPSSPLSAGPQGGSPEDEDVVTATGWWLVPGGPQKLLSWETKHLIARYPLYGTGMNGPGIYNESFSVSPVPGLFDERDLTVSASAAGHGQVAIRVDALVDWIPIRAAGDTVPASAQVAVLTETGDASGRGKPPVVASKMLTNAKQVTALAAYLNRLPVNVPGKNFNCPGFGNGGGLTISFLARLGGPALSQASASLSGCGFLTYTMPGHSATGLGEAEAGGNLLTEINHVTGLHWAIP